MTKSPNAAHDQLGFVTLFVPLGHGAAFFENLQCKIFFIDTVKCTSLVEKIASRAILVDFNVLAQKIDFALQLCGLIAARRLLKDFPGRILAGIFDGAVPLFMACILAFPGMIHSDNAHATLGRMRQDVGLKDALGILVLQKRFEGLNRAGF